MGTMQHAAAALAAVSVAGAGIFATALPAALPAAASAGPRNQATQHFGYRADCGDGATSGNEWVCVKVGQDPAYVEIGTKVLHSTRTVATCLRKDGDLVGCTPYEVLGPGQTETATFPYTGPGRYCAVTWRENENGTYTLIDTGQCVTIF